MKNPLLFLTSFLLLSFSAFAASFPDVPEDHENYEAIEYLDENEIINGYEDGTFNPEGLVNRGEALKIIVGVFDIQRDGNYDVLFPDVLKEDWYFTYVMGAREAGIVSGYKDGRFKPGETINLAETLKIMALASKVELPDSVDADIFADVPRDLWFSPHVLYARNHNIVFSDDYGAVHPDQAMTRAAFSEVVYRMTIVLENDGEAFPLDRNWSAYESSYLPFKIKYDEQNWQLIEHYDEVVLLKSDREFLQFSSTRIYPNSAIVTIAVDPNDLEMTKDQYFSNVKTAFAGADYSDFDLDGLMALEVLYPSLRIVDWYVYLKNRDVLVVYTQYGNGLLGFQLQQLIKSMLSTLEYREINVSTADYTELLSQIFENALVEAKGMEMLNLLPDKLIIETDTIGVGTGPVDYYHSSEVDYTFKYERTGDVILDTRKGKTTAF